MQSEILEAVERNGTAWSPAVAEAFRQIYGRKHLFLNPTKYHGVVKENISYGPHERNVLDVYSPTESSTIPRPVIVYVHGGNLVAGDKVWYRGSLYANVGNYFASHGIVAVIINYRLVPDVAYPGGGDDIQMAREWVYHNISKQQSGNGDPEKVVLVGSSVGGLHIATNIYLADHSNVNSKPVFPPIAGIVYLSTPFSFDTTPEDRQTALRAYYETEDAREIYEHSPVGLIEVLSASSLVLDPRKLPCLIVLAQYDPEEIQDSTFSFIEKYRRKNPQGILPEFVVVAGHNHISHVCSIGTEDDVLGRILHEFVGKVCSRFTWKYKGEDLDA
ncbi:alpha/beta-hydrolase [Lentinula lateritia]|uniref:Alpha/beta-hydrolase n=1 Tax=Lentinula aff. lateritia TaxID=2804960 RepID=A0ACC1UCP1_9AGAR|nr:alpha/beta-hydrolase [Lentinula aff. lateritia]KAJ3856306.1 alpha/beta-hydrolase [Lentinula lateritia]